MNFLTKLSCSLQFPVFMLSCANYQVCQCINIWILLNLHSVLFISCNRTRASALIHPIHLCYFRAAQKPAPVGVWEGGGADKTCLPRGQQNRWPLQQRTHTPAGPGYGCHSVVNGSMRRQRGRGWTRTNTDEGGNRESRGQGHGRSLLKHMPAITVTLLIQWDTNTDKVRGGEPKQRLWKTGRGWEGESWAGRRQTGKDNEHRVPTISI